MGMDIVEARLEWIDEMAFEARTGDHRVTIDGDAARGPSPMQQVALGVAGCMGIDVVHILEKMRTPAKSLAVSVRAVRATEEPRRFTRIELVFALTGEIPDANLDRALRLSRERYCSAMATIRPDTEIVIERSISPPPPA